MHISSHRPSALSLVLFSCLAGSNAQSVAVYRTTPDLKQALEKGHALSFTAAPASGLVVDVDETKKFQTVDGFGAAMTDSSAWLLEEQLSPAQRGDVMRWLFDPRRGIGISFVRVPLGASDLARNQYSYDDMPPGQRDAGLKHFSIDHDREYILPAMHEALKLNPAISVMVTPWSPPGWMKTKDSMLGGQLQPDAYNDFAKYLAKSAKAYQDAGIPVKYLSVQNEPLYETKDYPGTLMLAGQERDLIGKFVGPALRAAGLKTEILAYDHNWDHPEYPEQILRDPVASQYVAGSAFHCYGGDVSAQGIVHQQYPGKGLWMTECSGGSWQQGNVLAITEKLVIESTRQWAKAVVLWGLALDEKSGPHTGGCGTCRALVTVDRAAEPHRLTYTVDYYAVAHASRFVHPGAVRIDSSDLIKDGLENVAFENIDQTFVLLVLNNNDAAAQFSVRWHGRSFETSMAGGSVATFEWH